MNGCSDYEKVTVAREDPLDHRTTIAGSYPDCAKRELNVGEYLDVKILDAERGLSALRDLKASLPGSFLTSGFSRVASLGWGR